MGKKNWSSTQDRDKALMLGLGLLAYGAFCGYHYGKTQGAAKARLDAEKWELRETIRKLNRKVFPGDETLLTPMPVTIVDSGGLE